MGKQPRRDRILRDRPARVQRPARPVAVTGWHMQCHALAELIHLGLQVFVQRSPAANVMAAAQRVLAQAQFDPPDLTGGAVRQVERRQARSLEVRIPDQRPFVLALL